MPKLRDNKSFVFLCGCATIWFAFYCWKQGLLDWFLVEESEGYQSTSALAIIVLQAAYSAISMVGLIAIGIVSGILKPIAEYTVDAVRAKFPKIDAAATVAENAIDFDKLTQVLSDIDERLRKVEDKR